MFVVFVNTEGIAHRKKRLAVVAKDTESTDRQIEKHDCLKCFYRSVMRFAYLPSFLSGHKGYDLL